MKPEIHLPLVSVVVICYNSSKTIVETLNSIKAQTYQNIELIVSDDCSPDNSTIEIIQKWLNANGSRFVHAELVTTDRNTGVAGNINRGVAHSHGEWIKSIAGDDILIQTAIEAYVEYAMGNPEKVRMCVSDVECFSENGSVSPSLRQQYEWLFEKEREEYAEQWRRVCCELVFVGPTFFYSRELFDEVGGFMTKYGCAEEWPFVYMVLKNGNRIFAVNKKLVKYRVSETSLSAVSKGTELRNPRLFRSIYEFFTDYPLKSLLQEHRYMEAWHYFLFYNSKMHLYASNGSWWARMLDRYAKYLSLWAYAKRLK